MELETALKKTLSKERFEHCKRVQRQCEELAEIYHVDYNLCSFVGLTHDFAREASSSELFERAKVYRLSQPNIYFERGWASELSPLAKWEEKMPVLAHGAAACQILIEHSQWLASFNSKEREQIFEAIENHTFGFLGMGTVTQILYISDFIEPGRRFDNSQFRALVGRISLPELAFEIVKNSTHHDLEKGREILPPVLEMIKNEKIR